MNETRYQTRGFGLLEIVIGVGIIVSVLIVSLTVILALERHQREILRQTQAAWLLVEGLEAARFIRDDSWSDLAGLNLNDPYGLSWDDDNNRWEFDLAPEVINGFTRTVILDETRRDSSGQIDPAGSVDEDTRQVTVSVEWTSTGGETRQRTVTTYLANLFKDE